MKAKVNQLSKCLLANVADLSSLKNILVLHMKISSVFNSITSGAMPFLN